MNELTPVQRAVLERIAALKTPQSSDDIAKHFAITRSTANHHMRALANLKLIEPLYRAKGMYYYSKTRAYSERLEDTVFITPRMPRAKLKKSDRGDAAMLQQVWANVVQA